MDMPTPVVDPARLAALPADLRGLFEAQQAMLGAERRRADREHKRAEHERAEQGARGRERSSTGTLPAHTRVFTCPNTKCDFKGPVSGKTKFSLVVFLFLLLLCPPPLIVGIIYALVTNGYKYECPGCGLQLAKE